MYNVEIEQDHTYFLETFTGAHPLTHNMCGENDAEDAVSLYKASQRGLGEQHMQQGYRAEHFPGDGAYFAKEREIAEDYARHYGKG